MGPTLQENRLMHYQLLLAYTLISLALVLQLMPLTLQLNANSSIMPYCG